MVVTEEEAGAKPANEAVERAGSRALSVFVRVLNVRILWAHAEGPLTSTALEARLGWAAKASLRVAIGNLCQLGALVRVPADGPGSGVATELTLAGRDLLGVADVLQHWLSRSPFGPIPLPDAPARGIVRALVAGWDSAILRALAEQPRSLSELNQEISAQSYPALKRRLSMLRSANLVTPVNGRVRSPVHGATQWLRCAVGPLSAAGRWELTHRQNASTPTTRHEIEAALLLALPLLELPTAVSGECVLAALASQQASADRSEHALAAVNVLVEEGRVVSVAPSTASTPKTWALGTPDDWLDAVVEGRGDGLRFRGPDADLVGTLVNGLHRELFPQRANGDANLYTDQ